MTRTPDQTAAYYRAYYARHREQIAARKRAYRARHREQVAARHRAGHDEPRGPRQVSPRCRKRALVSEGGLSWCERCGHDGGP